MISKVNGMDYKIRYKTSSMTLFLNRCRESDFILKNLKVVSQNEVEFTLSEKEYCRLGLSDFYNKESVVFERVGGLKKTQRIIIERIGIIVGFLISIIILFLLSGKLFYIKIMGSYTVLEKEILKDINALGYGFMTGTPKNTAEIEDILIKNHNFSMVSCVVKGNVLIVNIKEELPDIDKDFVQIISDDNCIINSIKVYAGTTKFKDGDLVKKGEVLVEPYYYENGNKVMIKPSAEISFTQIKTRTYNFKSFEMKNIRTGRSITCKSEFLMGDKSLFSTKNNVDFALYEIENKDSYLSNYLLPVRVKKEVAYELKTIEIKRNFEDEKDVIIENLRNEIYAEIKNVDFKDLKENLTITQIGDDYVINLSIEVPLICRY